MSFNLRAPDKIIIENLDLKSFEMWLEAYKDFRRLSKVMRKDDDNIEELEVPLFLTIAGLEMRNLINGLDHDNTFVGITTAIKLYLEPVRNPTVERHKFLCMQQGTESIQEFIVRLKKQAKICDFLDETVDNISNQMIRDQFIRGINSGKIREALLKESKLPLANAETIANSLICAETDTNVMNRQVVQRGAVLVNNRSQQKFSHSNNNNSDKRCFTCGKTGHFSKDCFRNAKCENCHKIGHTAKVCRGRSASRSRGQPKKSSGQIISLTQNDSNLRFAKLHILGFPINMLVDTGSSITVVHENFVKNNNFESLLERCDFIGKTANGSTLNINNFFIGSVCFDNATHNGKIFVSDKIEFDGIIGIDLIAKIGLQVGPQSGMILSLKSPIAEEFQDIFDKPMSQSRLLGIDPVEIIKTSSDAEPKQCGIRYVNKVDRPFVDEKITYLLDNHIIRESNSSWRHQPLVVPKDNGKDKRLCINYKPVNSVTEMDAYPLPSIQEIFDQLEDSQWFSKLDFQQFYHQLPLCESDIPKTAFYAGGKLYEYVACPFGLKNAPAYCARVLDKVSEGCRGVLNYYDDMVVHGKTKAEHDENLREIFERIRKHGLSLNLKKCMISQQEIPFLGFILGHGTKKPNPERISSIENFPLPESASQLQRFLGMSGFFSNFVPGYSDIAAPLFAKIKNFDVWTDEEKKCFETIKQKVAGSLLHIPNSNEQLKLYTDASGKCISGILVNENDQPVFFCSRQLTNAECRYDIVEKEALAIFWSITRCRNFLLGRRFRVLCDHKPLQYIFNNDKASAKVLRWRLQLQEFDFDVEYLPGSLNQAADCLSRVCAMSEIPAIAITTEEIKQAQSRCNQITLLKIAIEKAYVKRPSQLSFDLWSLKNHLEIIEGSLYVDGRLLIPFSLRLRMLTLAHGNHLGQEATYNRLHETYFWPKMKDHVVNFVQSCRICKLTKPKFYNPPMVPLIAKCPFECLSVDFVGELPEGFGYKYMLVIVDNYSRYPFVFPLRTMATSAVIECFQKVFAQFGYPDCILSDRGTSFESNEFKKFCSDRGIKKKSTTTYNPKGNSVCERFNQTLKNKIFQALSENAMRRTEWYKVLEYVLLDFRTTVHSTTEFRPVDLLFSFSCRGLLPYTTKRDCREAYQNIAHNRTLAKRHYDKQKSTKHVTFKAGDEVLVKAPIKTCFSSKGKVGKVVRELTNEVVEVHCSDKNRNENINKSRLSKLCTDEGSKFKCKEGYSAVDFRLPTRSSSTQRNTEQYLNADDAENQSSSSQAQGSVRRSQRISHLPNRFGSYVAH